MRINNSSVLYLVIGLIMFASTVIIFSVYFWQYFSLKAIYSEEKKIGIINIPTISSVMISKSDSNYHNIKADISVQVDEKDMDKYDPQTLNAKVTEIMGKLDYDRLDDQDSVQYIKATIEKGLADYIPPEKLRNIYITDIQSGNVKIFTSEDIKKESYRDKRLKALFPNID